MSVALVLSDALGFGERQGGNRATIDFTTLWDLVGVLPSGFRAWSWAGEGGFNGH